MTNAEQCNNFAMMGRTVHFCFEQKYEKCLKMKKMSKKQPWQVPHTHSEATLKPLLKILTAQEVNAAPAEGSTTADRLTPSSFTPACISSICVQVWCVIYCQVSGGSLLDLAQQSPN